MSQNKKLKVETLILVAVWENPFIFQGCFKITDLLNPQEVLYFFRCQSIHRDQQDLLNDDYSSEAYEFTHLYHNSGLIQLNTPDPAKEYALDMLKYALHVTLKEMIVSRKHHFTSIDDIAMQALIKKITPILNKEFSFPEDEHLGFAVAMDFSPQEALGHLAAQALLHRLEH